MFILTADQIRQAEKAIMDAESITSLELMERAVERMFPLLLLEAERFAYQGEMPVVIFLCGTGNNGGDGLGLARLYHEAHPGKATVVIPDRHPLKPNTQQQMERLPRGVKLYRVTEGNLDTVMALIGSNFILVDALFGSGLSRPASGLDFNLIQKFGHFDFAFKKISIDIPSGVPADAQFLPKESEAIQADVTYSILERKWWEILPDTAAFGGEIIQVPLHTKKEFQIDNPKNHLEGGFGWLTEVYIYPYTSFNPPPRTRFGHKGTYGHALVIGGSLGKCGAIQLSGMASLHAGSGLTTLALPDCGTLAAQTSIPEAMCLTGLGQDHIARFPEDVAPFTAIGIGPGLGRHPETAEAFHQFLKRCDLPPLVLDADALNILSENPDWLDLLPENTILTPHPKEFDRLANRGEAYATSRERVDAARAFALRHKVVLVLKGGYTFVFSPDNPPAVVGSGAPELATGGTGDVLTGIVTSLRAQKMEAFAAAVSGCYLHGIASQLATGRLGEEPRSFTLTAGDLARNVGRAMLKVFG